MSHLVVAVVILAVLYTRGSSVSLEARHLRLAALPLLPFICDRLMLAASTPSILARGLAAAGLGLFLVLPAGYGLATLAVKTVIRRASSFAQVGPQGLRLDLLGSRSDARGFYAELATRVPHPETLLFLPHPEEAFGVAHRRILVVYVDILSVDILSGLEYRGRPAGGVMLVLPSVFDENGKRQVIQRAFRDLQSWDTIALTSAPGWALWWGR